MPDIVTYNRVSIRLGVLLDRPTDVAQVVPRPALLYRPLETLICDPDQLEPVVAHLADEHGLNCYDPQRNQLRTPWGAPWRFELTV